MDLRIATADDADRTANAADKRKVLNELTHRIIGIAITIHNKIGPGFVEKIYCDILAYEFKRSKLKFKREAEIKVRYDNLEFGYQRVDFLVKDKIIVEVKSVSEIHEIHQAQLLSYLRTADKRVGLILNFAKNRLEVKRLVNRF